MTISRPSMSSTMLSIRSSSLEEEPSAAPSECEPFRQDPCPKYILATRPGSNPTSALAALWRNSSSSCSDDGANKLAVPGALLGNATPRSVRRMGGRWDGKKSHLMLYESNLDRKKTRNRGLASTWPSCVRNGYAGLEFWGRKCRGCVGNARRVTWRLVRRESLLGCSHTGRAHHCCWPRSGQSWQSFDRLATTMSLSIWGALCSVPVSCRHCSVKEGYPGQGRPTLETC